MNKRILVSRPEFYDGTEYLSVYAGCVIEFARENGWNAKDFRRENANKKEIEKFLTKKKCSFVFLNGHGNSEEICGNKNEVIFSNENYSLLKDKAIYVRACSVANGLGKKIIEEGSGCFIGYTSPFSFWINSCWSAKPLNDKSAALYLKPSNEIVLQMLNGKSANDADRISKSMMIKNMRELVSLNKKDHPEAMGMLQILWNNYKGQVVLGNKEATI